MKKRKYQLRRRAEGQEETRRKIVDALVDLHEHLGPRATTVSAIAEKAGVQRLTVYRHFPDEVAMFTACSSHWLSEHPLPDPAIWRAQPDWRGRCRAAFAALYTYYRRNTGMLTSVFRDADLPAMQGPMQGFAAYFGQVHADLLEVAEPALAGRTRRSRPPSATPCRSHLAIARRWLHRQRHGCAGDELAGRCRRQPIAITIGRSTPARAATDHSAGKNPRRRFKFIQENARFATDVDV